MTREHLIDDIRSVIDLVGQAEQDPQRGETVRLSVRGLFFHIRDEHDVPGEVRGCLEESVRSLDDAEGEISARQWGYARTCLEAALEYAQGEGTASPV